MTPGQAIYEQANPHPHWPWARLTGREQAGWEHAARLVATVEAVLGHSDGEVREGHGANRAGRRALADELRAAVDGVVR